MNSSCSQLKERKKMDLLPLAIIFSVVGIAFGLFMVFQAPLIIKWHIQATARANWRVEPISMEKEIKNTKFRGMNLMAICILAIVYIKLFIS